MALEGNLRDFAATEILQLLGSQKKTGCLMLEWNTEKAVVYVDEGRIVSTRSPGKGKQDSLLTFLLRVHRLSEDQYRGILTIQNESGRDLEDILLKGRYLDREELTAYVERQIQDDLMRITRWESGNYRFLSDETWPRQPLLRMSIEGAMIEAARRADEQKRFLAIFRDPHQVLGLRDLPDPDEPLTEEVRELFGIIDGQHTVAEIVESAPLTEYEAYEAIHQMLEAKWIEIVGRRSSGPVEAIPAAPPIRRTARPLQLIREVVLAVSVTAGALGLHTVSQLFSHHRPTDPAEDIYIAARLREVELSLDLYTIERGHYPSSLEDLVTDRWLAPHQLMVPGHILDYRPLGDGKRYSLDLQVAR